MEFIYIYMEITLCGGHDGEVGACHVPLARYAGWDAPWRLLLDLDCMMYVLLPTHPTQSSIWNMYIYAYLFWMLYPYYGYTFWMLYPEYGYIFWILVTWVPILQMDIDNTTIKISKNMKPGTGP